MSDRFNGERAWLMTVLVALLALSATLIPAACGATSTDLVRPAYVSTIEACRQRQERAVEQATTREEALAGVADVRRRCDIAYAGLEAAAAILDETLPTQGEETP